jgi:hypothetical protein
MVKAMMTLVSWSAFECALPARQQGVALLHAGDRGAGDSWPHSEYSLDRLAKSRLAGSYRSALALLQCCMGLLMSSSPASFEALPFSPRPRWGRAAGGAPGGPGAPGGSTSATASFPEGPCAPGETVSKSLSRIGLTCNSYNSFVSTSSAYSLYLSCEASLISALTSSALSRTTAAL